MSRRALRGRWIVRLPTWLGDTVMSVPTIRVLARNVDELLLWGPEGNGRLLRAAGVNAELIPYRRRPGPAGALDLIAGVRALGAVGASGALLLPNAVEPALMTRLAGIRRRVGYATEMRGRLLTDSAPPPDELEALHETRRFAALLELLALPAPQTDDALLAAPTDAAARVERLVGSARPLLGLVPGSANAPAKRWPASAYAALASDAARRWGAVPVLIGSAGDRTVSTAVARACAAEAVDLAGKTDVIDLASVLSVCRAIVSNDTGGAHLAAALGTPTLTLFGPTDPRRTRPLGPHTRVASVAAFCQPCNAPVCPLDHRCMDGLTPAACMTALAPLWDSAGDRHRC